MVDCPPSKKNKFDDSFNRNLPPKSFHKRAPLPPLNELLNDPKSKLQTAESGMHVKKDIKLPSLDDLLENNSKQTSSKVKLPPPDIVVLNSGNVPVEEYRSDSPTNVKSELPLVSKVTTYSNLFLTPNVKLFSPNGNLDLGVRKLCCILQSSSPESTMDHYLISDFMECICNSSPFNPDNIKRIIQSLQTNNLQAALTVARICSTNPTVMETVTDTVKDYMETAVSACNNDEKEEFYEALLSSYSHLNLWSDICSHLDKFNEFHIASGIKVRALELGMNSNFPGRECVTVCAEFAPVSLKSGQFSDMQGLALLWVRCIEENEGLWARNIGVAVNKDKTFKTCVIEFLEQSIPTWTAADIIPRAVELVKSWTFILSEIRVIYSKRFCEIELPTDSFQVLVNKLSTLPASAEVDTFLVYVGIGFAQQLVSLSDWSAAETIVFHILQKEMCYWKVDLGTGPIHSVLFVMEVLVHARKFDRAVEVMNNCPMVIQMLHGTALVERRSNLVVQIMNGFLESGDLESARIVSEIIFDFISKDNQFIFNELDSQGIWEQFISKYINNLEENPDYQSYTKCLDFLRNKLRGDTMPVKLDRIFWSRLIKIGIDMKYEPRYSMLEILDCAIKDEVYPPINVKDRFLFLPNSPERYETNLLLFAYLYQLKTFLLEILADKKESVNLLDLCHLTLVETSLPSHDTELDNDFFNCVSDALNDLIYIENTVKCSRGNETNVILDNIDVYNCVFNLQ